MRSVIYSFGVSLDGYISGPDGTFAWSVPDEELHRFHNARVAELDLHILGRRLYETMVYWETAHENPSAPDYALEFAHIWQALPKLVVSTTLDEVTGNTRLIRDGVVEEVARLREQPGKDIAVGGAALAATLLPHGLIDELQLFYYPVVVGGGMPCFPRGVGQIDFELVETRTFNGGVELMRLRHR